MATNTVDVGTARTYDSGLLLLRLAVGLIMAAHGAQQLFGWFGGGGIEGTAGFFESLGYSAATLMAVLSGLSHLLGGLALAVGLFTPLACAAIIGSMLNAVAANWSAGFFALNGGYEYELLLVLAAAALALTGPGRLAIDRGVPVLRAHRTGFGAAAIALGVLTAVIVLVLFR